MTPDLTRYILIAAAVALALYDIAARLLGGDAATISVVVADASHRWPVVAFVTGFLAGHIFFSIRGPR